MAAATILAPETSASGYLLVLALMLPAVGVVLSFALGGQHAARITIGIAPVSLALSIAIVTTVVRSNAAIEYVIGGWTPPLGVALRAGGFSAAMLLTTSVVMGATAIFALGQFRAPQEEGETRESFAFWTLFLGLWAGLNAVFLSNDLFSVYVALELLTFAAVPMVSLDGRAATVAAALRYLLFALVGSVLYLLGAALIYGAYGTLDISLLGAAIRSDPVTVAAIALMTVGLLAKTALFPLYIWLPPAHAGAPTPASAVLSALVVKASFFLVVRLWFELMPELLHQWAAQFIAALGAAAIVFGSMLALRQKRLKMLIAYSTVAQIGYLFLIFPLAALPDSFAAAGAGATVSAAVLTGGVLQAVSHAFAKAAMFMGAGLIGETIGHDRLDGLQGIGRVLPWTVAAFLIAGLSLMGVPPSGGFRAKWLLLSASVATGQWWWALVIVAGGVFAGGYVYRVVAPALSRTSEPIVPLVRVSRGREAIVFALAFCSLLLGLMALAPLDLVLIGQPSAIGTGAP